MLLPPRKAEEGEGNAQVGKKNIHMDPKCMSCSGQLAGGLLSCFKLACLAYSPSNIVFRNIDFSRRQLMMFRKFILGQCNKLLLTSVPFNDCGLSSKKLFDDTYLYFME